MVFESYLTHDKATFRTFTMHPMFANNGLALNEKGLLVTEQPLPTLGADSRSYRVRDSNPYYLREREAS